MGFHIQKHLADSACDPESDLPRSATARSGLRFYSPKLGRWLSRDPIRETGGLNLYAFVANSPLSRWDSLGLFTRQGIPFFTPGAGGSFFYFFQLTDVDPACTVSVIQVLQRDESVDGRGPRGDFWFDAAPGQDFFYLTGQELIDYSRRTVEGYNRSVPPDRRLDPDNTYAIGDNPGVGGAITVGMLLGYVVPVVVCPCACVDAEELTILGLGHWRKSGRRVTFPFLMPREVDAIFNFLENRLFKPNGPYCEDCDTCEGDAQ